MRGIKSAIKNTALLLYIWRFLDATRFYVYNHFISFIPIYFVRHQYLKTFLGVVLGKKSSIHMGCFITGNNIKIGDHTIINRRCYLDGRIGIDIGHNVSISPECYILSLTHDGNSPMFDAVGEIVKIRDFAWLGARCIIQPGIVLGKGCIVGSGSVVTKSFRDENLIIGGIPAKFLKNREIEAYNYKLAYFPFYDTDVQF